MVKRKGSADPVAKTDTKSQKQTPKAKAGGEKRTKKSGKTTARCASKYFGDPPSVKEEPVTVTISDDDENEDIATPLNEGGATMAKVEKKEEEDDSEEEEWEDVEELAEPLCAQAQGEPVLPSQPVEIEIETPEHARKRQRREKREADFNTYLRRMMNRFNKDLQVDTHKVHLLCLVANGMFRNRLCSEPDLLAVGLSMVPAHFTAVTPEQADAAFLSNLLQWFQSTFTLTPDLPQDSGDSPHTVLERRFQTLSARNHQEMTHLFLIVLRSLQLFCRLVLSLQPLPLKLPSAKVGPPHTVHKKPSDETFPAKQFEKSPTEPKISPGVKRGGDKSEGRGGPGGKKPRKNGVKQEKEAEAAGQRPKNSQRRRVASKVSYKEDSSEGEGSSEGEEFQVPSEGDSEDSDGAANRRRSRKGRGKGAAPRRRRSKKETCSEEEEEEEEEEEKGRWRRKGGVGEDEWLEVYLERVGRWVCLDIQRTEVGQVQQCSRQATQPLSYILAVDGDGYLKDLSSRYDPTWMTSSRKRRVEPEWWEEALSGFQGPKSQREQREDQELQAKLLDKPLPTVISEFKNHPLYALKRHLLKYEALYPPTAAILGYCRGEAVYSRDCVHTLHSRDTWLKEARTVRLGEEPYKMVKGFSNRARKARQGSEQKDKDDLPLFGVWQTEEYQPPVAVDGKVPRNEYGNVYLFRPCMLPVGCVHVRLPNLHRVARKLDIDCAAAVTGFDFHCGFSHPVTDGYVVCEEHQEVLQAAWENEQEILEKKEREKREKRAVDHWALLVKGLLIRERLKRRYGRQKAELPQTKEGDGELSSGEEDNAEADSPAATLAASWPQNRQEAETAGDAKPVSKRDKRGQEKHLFPFEKV
ncbi:DNA repair protein complementing XP-C cells [Megalops cyprinoides]|uniref:DNA repair protein complementing XP-C cells n=1 Tax=Megalops cyprinoides TaxID=118141 RepID=UPI001863C08E|nr:DNA repair protein complementing XP-C cells [Megalops cyprinoides]